MKNYCLCDRTLVEGISKVPWMSIIKDSKLIQTELPLHKNIKLSDEEIASKFIELISEEDLRKQLKKDKLKIMIRNAFLYPKLPKLRHFKKLIGR